MSLGLFCAKGNHRDAHRAAKLILDYLAHHGLTSVSSSSHARWSLTKREFGFHAESQGFVHIVVLVAREDN